MLTKLAIVISQGLNVVITLGKGDEDEQLSSACWRKRYQPWWRELRWVIDNASPVMFWRDAGKTHCESSYDSERRKRLECKRFKGE